MRGSWASRTSTSRASRATKRPPPWTCSSCSVAGGVSTDHLLTGQETAPADIAGAIRAEPHLSAAAKRHLIGLANELRGAS